MQSSRNLFGGTTDSDPLAVEPVDLHARAEQVRRSIMVKPQELQQLPFEKAAESWLAFKSFASPSGRSRYVSPRSLDDLKQYIKVLAKMFGSMKLADIHIGYLREYQQLRASGELLKNGEVGPNKINQEVGLLKRIMKYAQCWTPELEEMYMPLQREENDIPQALTPAQQSHWLLVAESLNELVYWYSGLGFDCPLSSNETRGLRIGDIDRASNLILVRVQSSKNKYRTRTVPLSDFARWCVDGLLERAAKHGATAPMHYLMPFCKSHEWNPSLPMTVSGIKKPWDQVRKAAGLEWFNPHLTRHTSITRYAEAGTPIPTIMSMAGHVSRKMLEHYTWISEQAKRKAVQKVGLKTVGLLHQA